LSSFMPSVLEFVGDPDFSGEKSSNEYKRNWARLIQRLVGFKGKLYPDFFNFTLFRQDQAPDSLSWHSHPSQPHLMQGVQFQAASYPHNPASGTVEFRLAHKVKSPKFARKKGAPYHTNTITSHIKTDAKSHGTLQILPPAAAEIIPFVPPALSEPILPEYPPIGKGYQANYAIFHQDMRNDPG